MLQCRTQPLSWKYAVLAEALPVVPAIIQATSCAECTVVCRGLALVPGKGLASASHDTTLRLWNAAGTCVRQYLGHTALVYACAATPEGLLASASEDNTARLWQGDGSCLQVIPHPGVPCLR